MKYGLSPSPNDTKLYDGDGRSDERLMYQMYNNRLMDDAYQM